MKKIILMAPIMALSLLTNCGGAKKQSYKVSVAEHDHLSFTTTDGKPLDGATAIEDEVFTFNMKVDSETYKLPGIIYIYIGDSDVELADGFKIETIAKNVEAKVTIAANKVVGDIKIKANAVKIDYYQIDIKTYGVNHSVDVKNPFAITSESKDITFTQIESYALPTDENIYLNFDNTGWKKPSEASTYCTYDVNSHKLTINADAVNSSVKIRVRSMDYQLLNDLSWEEINQYSTAGWAPYMFYLGETKKLQMSYQDKNNNGIVDEDEVYQTVRIIGFNEDYTELPEGGGERDPNKAIGITFEFADLLSDVNGFSLAAYWNDTNETTGSSYNYKNSTICRALNGSANDNNWFRYYGKDYDTEVTGKNRKFAAEPDYKKSVVNMLPESLKREGILKTPSKYINIKHDLNWKEETVNGKIFLLSPVEMGRTEHTDEEPHTITYSYYDGADDTKIVKRQINGIEGARTNNLEGKDLDGAYEQTKRSNAGYNDENENYGGYCWLRSPLKSYYAWRVMPDGTFDNYNVFNLAFGIAPAFCI